MYIAHKNVFMVNKHANLITNSIQAWLTKDYSSSGMSSIIGLWCRCHSPLSDDMVMQMWLIRHVYTQSGKHRTTQIEC